jgi:hypothetical protein
VEPGIVIIAVAIAGAIALLGAALHPKDGPSAPRPLPERDDRALLAELQKAAGTLPVALSAYVGERGEKGLRFGIGGLCPDLNAQPAGSPVGTGASGWRNLQLEEIVVGDGRFDAAFDVEGDPQMVHALLDEGTRRALLGLIEHRLVDRVELRAGVLRMDVPLYTDAEAPGALSQVGLAAVHAARLLRPVDDVAERLARIARADAEPLVRGSALTVLAHQFAAHPDTRPALRAATTDPDADVRLCAGVALGPEGRPVLLALTVDEAAPEECVVRAVQELGADLGVEDARVALQGALRRRRFEAARACMRALAAHGGPAAVPVLAGVLDAFAGAMGVAAAAGLAALGLPESEGPLLAVLTRVSDADRLIAIAAALGAVGSRDAVVPLREAASRHRGVDREVERALASIQERLVGTPGELSLAELDSGRVSLSEDGGGRVSIDRSRDKR